MNLTRREFVECTTAAVGAVGMLSGPLPKADSSECSDGRLIPWPLIVPAFCSVPESLLGYRAALPQRQRWFVPDARLPMHRDTLVIVPSALNLSPSFAMVLMRLMKDGATVILESGAGFASHWMFRQHRRSMREGLALRLGAPVDLWSPESKQRAPYIQFTWPRHVRVRDFSRIVPPADRPGDDVIAWAGDLAAAFRRRVGKGMLLYLGSPIGPALWAGDVEARRWLYAVALAA